MKFGLSTHVYRFVDVHSMLAPPLWDAGAHSCVHVCTPKLMSDTSESYPPSVDGIHVPSHPLWEQSRGGGRGGRGAAGRGSRGRGRGTAPPSEAEPPPPPPRMMGISLVELEQRHRAAADGAESSLWSDDEEGEEDEGVSGEAEGDDDGGAAQDRPQRRRPGAKKRSRSNGPTMSEAVAAATFGGGEAAREPSEFSEAESAAGGRGGQTREERRLASRRRAFPIRGVTCLGCSADREQIGKVDEFVKQNLTKLSDVALWKSAALCYKQKVCDPAAAEGVEVPIWPWKDLRSHYLLHAVSMEVQRVDVVRSLAAMRKVECHFLHLAYSYMHSCDVCCAQTLEMSLLKEEDDGARVLCPKSADLMLKLIAAQSKEMQLITSSSMPPPPAPTGRAGKGAGGAGGSSSK